MPNAKKRRNQPIGGRGASPPSGEDALRLSPVCHSGRNPKSDRMRRPPSLAGSERGELQKCKNKPIRQVSNESQLTKRSQIAPHFQGLYLYDSSPTRPTGAPIENSARAASRRHEMPPNEAK